jgi:hypothetical protein
MLTYNFPGFLHLFGPMNVVKYKYGILACFVNTMAKVGKGGLFLVVGVEKNKIYLW